MFIYIYIFFNELNMYRMRYFQTIILIRKRDQFIFIGRFIKNITYKLSNKLKKFVLIYIQLAFRQLV